MNQSYPSLLTRCNNLLNTPSFSTGAGSTTNVLTNLLMSPGAYTPLSGTTYRSTALMSPFSNALMTMLSFSHTPFVHTDKGPTLPFPFPEPPNLPPSRSSADFSSDVSGSCGGGNVRRRDIRFARTISVNIRSPTTMSSSSWIGAGKEEKYARMAEMQE
ncbi:hypothetical protein PHLCEN_2v6806 [Hermanssonia centrifuga]|uniref:Uncharacterized protein n=1 Tax=Hermanssonia centrifuga TaxID=98765 RepID=A0A2R6NYC7_9APHY|nr:hypothetical protein PHLCEN_2v6806 [Hermanssonia centrifuga]